jgi:hypothetical protein
MSRPERSGTPATWPLPREIESDPRHGAIRRALEANARPLWPDGTLRVPVVPFSEAVQQALRAPSARAALVRGLEAADGRLASEARGRTALSPAVAARQGDRVSRLLLVTADGAERLARRVERLALRHAPRVLVCRVEATSADLGACVWGPGAAAKVVLVARKEAAAAVLRALAAA